jgi:hypothetical protein
MVTAVTYDINDGNIQEPAEKYLAAEAGLLSQWRPHVDIKHAEKLNSVPL